MHANIRLRKQGLKYGIQIGVHTFFTHDLCTVPLSICTLLYGRFIHSNILYYIRCVSIHAVVFVFITVSVFTVCKNRIMLSNRKLHCSH